MNKMMKKLQRLVCTLALVSVVLLIVFGATITSITQSENESENLAPIEEVFNGIQDISSDIRYLSIKQEITQKESNRSSSIQENEANLKEITSDIEYQEVTEEKIETSTEETIQNSSDTNLNIEKEQEVTAVEESKILDMYALTEEEKESIVRSVITEAEEKKLAQTIYGEDRGNNLMRRSAVIWCIYNRLDSGNYGNSIDEVVTHNQFHGWFESQNHPEWAHELVRDVTIRYALEKQGYENIGRTLPNDYYFFSGRDGKNWFRKEYKSSSYWDFSYTDPYNGAYDFSEIN